MDTLFDREPVYRLGRPMGAVMLLPLFDYDGERRGVAVRVDRLIRDAQDELVTAIVRRSERKDGIGQWFGQIDRYRLILRWRIRRYAACLTNRHAPVTSVT